MRISAIFGFLTIYDYIFRAAFLDWTIFLFLAIIAFGFEEAIFWIRKYTTRMRVVKYEYERR